MAKRGNGMPMRGIAHITGEADTGKTTFTLTVPGVSPSEIVFFDDDAKTRGLAEELEIAGTPLMEYHDLASQVRESGKLKPVDFYHLMDEHLTRLEAAKKKPKVIVFDNWSRMEGAIRAYSETIMTEISNMSPGQIKSMSTMTWPHTYNFYQSFMLRFVGIAPLFFITTHITEAWGKPGVLVSRGQRPLYEKTNFRVWLRHNPDGPEPIGLVLKRIQTMRADGSGTLRPVNILPRRIKPCTWDRILHYLEHPIGDREPEEDEIPNAFELSILDGTLTDDQKDAIRLAAATEERKAREEAALEEFAEEEQVEKAKEMKEAGKSLPEIAKELGVTPGEVAGLLRG